MAAQIRQDERTRFGSVRAVLAAVADGEGVERGVHDFDAFLQVPSTDKDEAELEAAFQVFLDGVVLRCTASGVFGRRCACVWVGHRGDVLQREGLGLLQRGGEFLIAIRGIKP